MPGTEQVLGHRWKHERAKFIWLGTLALEADGVDFQPILPGYGTWGKKGFLLPQPQFSLIWRMGLK